MNFALFDGIWYDNKSGQMFLINQACLLYWFALQLFLPNDAIKEVV